LSTAPFVAQVTSDKTGRILISFKENVFPTMKNTVSLTPMINDQVADLSDPANANLTPVWQCGKSEYTTIEAQNLPTSCR
jgi:hypothetical protein